jgi:hypothetical protein
MKYAGENPSVARILMSSFVKFGSGIQKSIWGIHKHTRKSLLFFFKIKWGKKTILVNENVQQKFNLKNRRKNYI